jgi:hypothetical protein
MKFFVTITQVNSNFDKKYAKENNFGKESDENPKNHWSISPKIPDQIIDYKLIESKDFSWSGKKKNGDVFDFLIPDMKIMQCITNEDELIEIALSNSLIIKTQLTPNLKYDTVRFYFYINDKVESLQINPLVYIDKKDIPKELLL